MIRAKHNILIYNFFKLYTLYKIRRNFHSVTISGNITDKGLPVLVISNHFSWWDGFWVMYVNLKVFKRKFHFMMLEEQLEKYWFFKYTGGFSVRKGARSVLDTIGHARELLLDGKNLVLVFPQGEIHSLYDGNFRFEKGTERILKDYGGRIQVILNANLLDFQSEQKPSLYLFMTEYTLTDTTSETIEGEYNRFYKTCVSSLVNKTTTP
jgi:1-acyl-sn-glycerol-3-phosphate acyltransferase